MLRVALVGCGKIADAHAHYIQNINGCEIVGVCDHEPLMAKQLYDRFRIRSYFSDLGGLLEDARPDVVHVTTPPESHYDLARLCLQHGCHVYVEKPFTTNAAQARALLHLAQDKGLKLTVGHNDQFSHVARRMRGLIATGYLGGPPVHMESYYGYDLGDPRYARALLGDKRHWVRRLPGKLLQNVISHGIARIAEFLTDDAPRVLAYGFASPFLKSINEDEIIDELRVMIVEKGGATAYFTFSSQMRPSLHEFRIYGPKGGLILDQDHDVLLQLRGKKFTSYADKFIPPLIHAKQQLGNLATNVRLFLRREFHMDCGLKYLISAFYDSIRKGTSVPVSYREILVTATIMDLIFSQLSSAQLQPTPSFRPYKHSLASECAPK